MKLALKTTPASNLRANKREVCPNTEVTLNPNCSIPTATVSWTSNNPSYSGSSTIKINLPDQSATYTAVCTADGCSGASTSVTVRSHNILVSLMDVGTLAQPASLVGPVTAASENLAVTASQNTFIVPISPRKWNLIATGCSTSESAVFEFTSGPFAGFRSVDNNVPYAVFANVGATYFAQDHPNYGNGIASFPNGTYTLKVDLRSADGIGGLYPKNRQPSGSLLATRTLSFTIANPLREGGGNDDVFGNEIPDLKEENWASIFTNPVSNEVVVRLSGKVGETVQLNMVNLQGQVVDQSGVSLESVSQYATINASSFTGGFYILKAIKGDKIKTIKVLKVE